jgi:hypothetical protein
LKGIFSHEYGIFWFYTTFCGLLTFISVFKYEFEILDSFVALFIELYCSLAFNFMMFSSYYP